jgi:hypothetical protein
MEESTVKVFSCVDVVGLGVRDGIKNGGIGQIPTSREFMNVSSPLLSRRRMWLPCPLPNLPEERQWSPTLHMSMIKCHDRHLEDAFIGGRNMFLRASHSIFKLNVER